MARMLHTEDTMGQLLDSIMSQVEIEDNGDVLPQFVVVPMGDDPVFVRMYSRTERVVHVNLHSCDHRSKTMTFRVSSRGEF